MKSLRLQLLIIISTFSLVQSQYVLEHQFPDGFGGDEIFDSGTTFPGLYFAVDFNQDGKQDLVIRDSLGTMNVYDMVTYNLLWEYETEMWFIV